MNNKVTSFEDVLEMLLRYKNEKGNLMVPVRYMTGDGVSLGTLVQSIRTGKRKLSNEQRQQLEEIGFEWERLFQRQKMDAIYEMLEQYKAEHGNCNVKYRYITKDGVRLGLIVARIRNGVRKITPEQRKRLEEIGFPFLNTKIASKGVMENNTKHNNVEKEGIIFYVIDSSIIPEYSVWNPSFDKIIEKGCKLVIVSPVLRELDEYQRQETTSEAYGARRLLARAAEDEINFLVVRIDESEPSLEENLLIFCGMQKNCGVITADAIMALKARLEGIPVEYLSIE